MHRHLAPQLCEQRPPSIVLVDRGVADVDVGEYNFRVRARQCRCLRYWFAPMWLCRLNQTLFGGRQNGLWKRKSAQTREAAPAALHLTHSNVGRTVQGSQQDVPRDRFRQHSIRSKTSQDAATSHSITAHYANSSMPAFLQRCSRL